MKKLLILSLLCFQSIHADYFSYLKQIGRPNGNYREGEIEVVVDPAEMARIQKVQQDRLLKKGFSASDAAEYSRVGIVCEDQYWLWLRDAVLFPEGVPGTYNRLIWKSQLNGGSPGVAVLPVLPSGKIVLNLNYRHATRSWELELPRGGTKPQESLEAAAAREVKEETGMVASSITHLGNMAPDTGVLSSIIPVYMGKVTARGEAAPEYSEAIADVIAFTKEEIKEGLKQGFLEVEVEGKKKQVPIRDAFLTFALLQAEIRKLL